MTNTEIQPLTYVDPDDTPYTRGILYGEFGHWKTVTAASCINAVSENATGLLLAADDGWVSLKNHPEILERTKIVKYLGLSQITQISEGESERYDLIVVDTITQIQEDYVDFLMDNVTWNGNFRETSVPKRGSKVKGEEIPGLPDYHLTRNKLRRPLRKLLAAPCDVIFLAHLREPSFIEQQKGKLVRRPAVTQKVFEFIAREAHFIGFMEKQAKKEVATISFKPDPRTTAKSRIGLLDNQVINAPDLPEFLKKWKNS
jgi:hypothetical protein